MTRLFLAAGVAALAIAMPASAKPGEHGGGNAGNQAAPAPSRGGGNAAARGGGGAQRIQFQQVQRGPRSGGSQMRSVERRSAAPRIERGPAQRFATVQHGRGGSQVERGRARAARPIMVDRRVNHGSIKTQRVERQQVRNLDLRQIRANRMADRGQQRAIPNANIGNRLAVRDQLRANRPERFDNRMITRDDVRSGRLAQFERRNAVGYGVGGCPPGLASRGCMPPGQAAKLLGSPLSSASRFAALSSVPLSARYLYPDTDDYFYRYGDGYLYRVDRGDQLISALLPLLGGGYMPGMVFPSAYNYNYAPGYTFPLGYNDPYVSDYYGFNSFYPDTQYVDYRYLNGNVYGVDPYSGLIDNVIPTYAYGYGVGQVLPASYGYYNVPYQYRDMYYNTSDYNYWYAPGAIYQVDPSSQMITSVASLLSPGLSIGQPLPLGYDVYNVPYDYRATYYDTPTAWYRYNNGNIYQVDPTSRLVTAIVASLLT